MSLDETKTNTTGKKEQKLNSKYTQQQGKVIKYFYKNMSELYVMFIHFRVTELKMGEYVYSRLQGQ